ncbi:MAG: dihydropteroate synthase [Acetobacter sp.]|jgi:dihydropteroate synthase|nr:dihydropteroate synthase [Acetobacter sp.]MCH4062552.1 dihydropteroate synthase [Acetobacter sp.]MCH4088602.1 dihydropteroate synthase [Acetobacter sp.]MCI1292508.1 dihydropteroate synthase [Acetobacter sp.]MCI1319394.1 dihydropteroate synthase [Acetobacter sp.]
MSYERLIEPAGLLHGSSAIAAIKAGLAYPLQGGPTAFSLAFLIDGNERRGPVPVSHIPEAWSEILQRITQTPPLCGLPDKALVMGILNLTADSFSDGGKHCSPEDAVNSALNMIQQGADMIDIGAESTRPGALPVHAEEEWRLLEPVILSLKSAKNFRTPISIDTRNAITMQKAINAGADVINDVSALTHDPSSRPTLAQHQSPVVLMHMRGSPSTMNSLTDYQDVAVDVVRELGRNIDDAVQSGIDPTRIIADPGFGFAKTHEQNIELLSRLPILANLGCRLLIGVSRKRFIGHYTNTETANDRDPGTSAASLVALSLRSVILRVHNVQQMKQSVLIASSIMNC